MADWMAWFDRLGSSVLDMGNPFTTSVTVAADGSTTDDAPSGLSGYSIVQADSLAAAAAMACQRHVVLRAGSGGTMIKSSHP